jgi:hypothetical protein
MAGSPALDAETTFSFGGYVKLDVLSTYYRNGDVVPESPLRENLETVVTLYQGAGTRRATR